ncbi:MAG: hypothetical protein IIB26_05675 [Chloroflexi bacterium]|nr:hypothetical protein [Chloroflexota bacterium]
MRVHTEEGISGIGQVSLPGLSGRLGAGGGRVRDLSMGGRQRERVRLHLLLKGRNRDEWVAAAHHTAVLRQVPPSATMPRPRSRATA